MTEHKIGNLFAPLDRIETPEEKAIRIAKGILFAEVDRACDRLESLELAKQSFIESAVNVDQALLNAPQEIIETLELKEQELIDRVRRAKDQELHPLSWDSEQV